MDENLSIGRPVVIYPDGRMDPKNTSTYVGLAEKTLAMMRCNGTGPQFVKIGRVFYFKKDVDLWLAQRGGLASTAQAKRRPVSKDKPC